MQPLTAATLFFFFVTVKIFQISSSVYEGICVYADCIFIISFLL